jgi:uncharacterized protein
MRIVDANVLLYAVDSRAPHHRAAKKWLDAALNGDEPTGFCWTVLLAFLRISTKSNINANALSIEQALTIVDTWLRARTSVVIDPVTGHTTILRQLLSKTGTGGNLTSDAHIAAIALEQRATVVTFDSDFARFAGVVVEVPR